MRRLLFLILVFPLIITAHAAADFGIGPIVGERRVLAVMVESPGLPLTCTKKKVLSLLHGTTTTSVVNYYTKASYGNMSFSVDSFGVFTVSKTCSDWPGLIAEIDALIASHGINKDDYEHILYLVPYDGSCRSFGSLGSPAVAAVTLTKIGKTCSNAILHELGHGLGFNHSQTPENNYGDSSDVMGGTSLSKYMNAPHGVEAGWIPAANVQAISLTGNYLLSTVDMLPSEAPHPQVLRIPTSDPSIDYYVSFRARQGFRMKGTKSQLSKARALINRTHVHKVTYSDKGSTPNPRMILERLAKLKDKQSFVTTEGIRIKQLNHGRTESRVSIEIQ